MKRHALRAGESLAIDPGVIRHDADGFFFLVGDAAPENEQHGTVHVVHVRGALCHFKGDGGDSYEAILERVHSAMDSDPKPSSVVLRIESPGGVVAGLNEAVLKLRRMSKLEGVPLVAYVDEMAASAAYALCCACEEVLAPPSAVVGSVGVISTMVSQARRDDEEGLDFRLITSGKRKADGHPHAPITDDAVRAETARNSELADQFFALASKARGMSPKKLQSLEAAIYLGKDAKRVGLVDDVMSFDDAILGLDTTESAVSDVHAPNQGNVTDRRAKEATSPRLSPPHKSLLAQPKAGLDKCAKSTSKLLAQSGTPGDREPMPVKLDALIKKTESALSAETDPKKLRTLRAELAAFTSTRAAMDDDDDGDGDDDNDKKKGEEDDEDESKAKKAAKAAEDAKRKAEASKHRAKAAEHKQKAAEYEEMAKKCEESEEESEESEASTSMSPGAMAAVASQADIASEALARVQKLEKSAAKRELSAMIEEARAQRRITPHEAKTLATKSHAFVKDFLEMRPKALVNIDESALAVPDGTPAGDIPENVKRIVDQAVLASGKQGKEADELREKSYAAHRAVMSKSNGAGAY